MKEVQKPGFAQKQPIKNVNAVQKEKPQKTNQQEELEKAQEKMIRQLMTKEIMGKIEAKINSEDSQIMKTFKTLIEEKKK